MIGTAEREQKRRAARAALEFVVPGMLLGVGSGSTVDLFIEELIGSETPLKAVVAASPTSSSALERGGYPVASLPEVGRLPLYVDGADEVDQDLRMIKGGGGALTREKIIASSSDLFVCIAHEAKLVEALGSFPVAIEVIDEARVNVARILTRLGGTVRRREGFTTENGNMILDVEGLDLRKPLELETRIDSIPGVVEVGVFARRPADVLLLGTDSGVERFERPRGRGQALP